eukprot:CAMPEP_0118893962 /NCGR_PEP_ID=MMETSP1166-20130328/2951_1 /TAXON_ID=1104430 /ORGANISM="Chrysoreinhardia sp, Strain CCMP3193" /LENGTH=527 /DNA_ID=CAMNT_0006832829 /DNA_START=194 /DNA_END=1777 /DNA_ORIENTATION=+
MLVLWAQIFWERVEGVAAWLAAEVLTREALAEVRVGGARLRRKSVTLFGVEIGNRGGRPTVAAPFFCRVGAVKAKCSDAWSCASLVGLKRFGGLRLPFVCGFAVRDLEELKLTKLRVVFDDGITDDDVQTPHVKTTTTTTTKRRHAAQDADNTVDTTHSRGGVFSCIFALCTARKLAKAVKASVDHRKEHARRKLEKEATFERHLKSVWNAVSTRRGGKRRRRRGTATKKTGKGTEVLGDPPRRSREKKRREGDSDDESRQEEGNLVGRLRRAGSAVLGAASPNQRNALVKRLYLKFCRADEEARQRDALSRRRKIYKAVVRVGRIVVEDLQLTLRGRVLTLDEPLEIDGLVGDVTEVRAKVVNAIFNALFLKPATRNLVDTVFQRTRHRREQTKPITPLGPPYSTSKRASLQLADMDRFSSSSSDDDAEGPLTFFRRGVRSDDFDDTRYKAIERTCSPVAEEEEPPAVFQADDADASDVGAEAGTDASGDDDDQSTSNRSLGAFSNFFDDQDDEEVGPGGRTTGSV